MTEVLFYSSAADRSTTACRLVRKLVRNGAGATVCLPPERMAAFDLQLWSFDATDFIAHMVVGSAVAPGSVVPRAGSDVDARLQRTPVWLVTDADTDTPHRVLLNLGDAPCAGFASYERLIEIVSDDANDKAAGRVRWKHYQSRGYAIVHHALSA